MFSVKSAYVKRHLNSSRNRQPFVHIEFKGAVRIDVRNHRGVKRVTRPMVGFKAFGAAQSTLAGIELMHMIRKKQQVVEVGKEGLTAAEQFYSLAA